jgi:hypothetical protein
MSPRAQAIAVVLALTMLCLIFELVRRRRLRIGYSLLWLLIGMGGIALMLFPEQVHALAHLMGIESPRSLLFSAGIGFILWILLDHSLTLTQLWRQNKDLAQSLAQMEWRVRQLQQQVEETPAPALTSPLSSQGIGLFDGVTETYPQWAHTYLDAVEEPIHELQ